MSELDVWDGKKCTLRSGPKTSGDTPALEGKEIRHKWHLWDPKCQVTAQRACAWLLLRHAYVHPAPTRSLHIVKYISIINCKS
jgi:hypothetical protein